REAHDRAAARPALGPDAPALSLDQAACDGEAQPGSSPRAGSIRSPEALERALERLRRDALARVLDADADLLLERLDEHGDGAVGRCVPERVREQVEQNALHLVRGAA